MKQSFKSLVDVNNVILAFNIGNVYFRNKVLVACDSQGNTEGYDDYESIEYVDGKIKVVGSNRLLSDINKVSGYYLIKDKG